MMDNIFKCAKSFQKLFNKSYYMKISYRKKMISFQLNFKPEDFFHLVGLQYLRDIDLGKNPKKVFDKIIRGEITDELLSKSVFYLNVDENYVIVKDRIIDFQYIEDLLDSRSIVFKFVKDKNPCSKIDGNFLILADRNYITYNIFLRKRKNEETYKLCSFFKESQRYNGDKAYWLYKEKVDIKNNVSIILYDRLSVNKSENK